MTGSVLSPSSILADVELPDPEPLPTALLDALGSLRVVLLGWYRVPEQTSPEQARDEFGAEAEAALENVADRVRDAGPSVTTRLVFTGQPLDTLTRISAEEACDAVLILGAMAKLKRLLVPLRGMPLVEQTTALVAEMAREQESDVTLLHVAKTDREGEEQRPVLRLATKLLAEQGVDVERVHEKMIVSDDPADTIVEEAERYDLLVLGETKPSIRDILFGSVPEAVAKKTDAPMIVVRHHGEANAAEQVRKASE